MDDKPYKSPKLRFRFGMKGLLAAVTLVGVGLYFRPGQVNPPEIPVGASKAWVYWNCGPPGGYGTKDWWMYLKRNLDDDDSSYPRWNVFFDEQSGRVVTVDDADWGIT